MTETKRAASGPAPRYCPSRCTAPPRSRSAAAPMLATANLGLGFRLAPTGSCAEPHDRHCLPALLPRPLLPALDPHRAKALPEAGNLCAALRQAPTGRRACSMVGGL